MKNKKTKTSACCTGNKKLHLVLIAFIILVTLGIIFLPKDNPSQKGITIDNTKPKPVVEMISNTVVVEAIEKIELVPTETVEIIIETDPVMVLDDPNSITTPAITSSENLVQTFLSQYNAKRFKDACDILIDTKCDDRIKASVVRFGEEFEKMDGGYQNVSVRQVDVPDFHSDIICVEYDYRYNASTNPKLIHEVMSFYVQEGKITYRICEAKTRDGISLGCPVQARKDFCL